MTGKNIFIDFSIIQNSDSVKMREELETLIRLKNLIYVWSKTLLPIQMRNYCRSVMYNDLADRQNHLQVLQLRQEKKSFKEISDITGIPIDRLSFFISSNPNKIWTLDDWIIDYFKKDSSIYSKVDFLVDTDEKIINRFKSRGIEGYRIDKL